MKYLFNINGLHINIYMALYIYMDIISGGYKKCDFDMAV